MGLRVGMSREKLVYVKKYVSEGEVVIAICDYEILDKKLVDSDKNITFYVDPNFYKGEVMSIANALNMLREATIANLIGKNIVEAAIEAGLISREAVIEIAGIPHAQLMVLEAEKL